MMCKATIISFFLKSLLCTSMCTLLLPDSTKAQQLPPRPISVYAVPQQGLLFGAFFPGATGGTVTINPNGTRSVTGDVIEANLGVSYSPAIFEIEANPGTVISILNGPDATLTGSNGGSIQLHLGSADTSSPFITASEPPLRTVVKIGGTLTVGNQAANPEGVYSGSFSINFIQE
jgi:hypothetical protein